MSCRSAGRAGCRLSLPSWGFALTALHFPCMVLVGGAGRPRYGRAMSPAPLPYDILRPVTITPDRYGGTYSGGAWLAFPLHPFEVPDGPFGGDVFAATWWDELGDVPVGRGDSPSGAYDDLVRRLEAIGPTQTHGSASKLSGAMWDWALRWPAGQVTTVSRMWRGEGRGPQPWPDEQ